MEYDEEKVAEYVLALLYLTTHGSEDSLRAWKGMDWDALNLLYENDYIGDPKSKAKSVTLTEKGHAKSKALFVKYFGKESE